jgi:Orthoreovirus membrane fusion protein p10
MYYYSKLYICVQNPILYDDQQYCECSKTYYYSRLYICIENPLAYCDKKYCESTKTYYLSKFYICPDVIIDPVNKASNILGAIVGGTIGGIILIIILIVFSFYCCCKKNVKNQPIGVSHPQELKPLTQSAYNPQPMMV